MTQGSRRNMAFITGIIFIALSLTVFLLADGLRRYYSGIFFLLIGIVSLAITRRELKK